MADPTPPRRAAPPPPEDLLRARAALAADDEAGGRAALRLHLRCAPDSGLGRNRQVRQAARDGDFETARRLADLEEPHGFEAGIVAALAAAGPPTDPAGWHARMQADPAAPGPAIRLLGALARDGRLVATPLPASAAAPIPRRLLQLWDSLPPPPQIADVLARNRAHSPGWTIEQIDFATATRSLVALCGHGPADRLAAAPNHAARADILRCAVICERGGLYLDADDALTGPPEPLVAPGFDLVVYRDEWDAIGNNVFAARPGHPAIRVALDVALAAIGQPGMHHIWLATAPGALTRGVVSQAIGPDGTPAPGLRILRETDLRAHVAIHAPLSYKGSDAHWFRTSFGLGTDDA